MRTVALIQAHMGSSRLPGKVLQDIAGQSMLSRVVRRAQACPEFDEVVVAAALSPEDDAIQAECRRLGVRLFRGSDADVLDRFRHAADWAQAEVCVRITSDCPLLDPGVSGEIVRRFRLAGTRPDYASNKIPQSFPRGLDTEVFTRAALEAAWESAREPYERAHVTIYLYEHPRQFRLLSVVSDVDRAHWRWTVDTREDLAFVRAVYDRLGADGDFGWLEVVALLEREPEWQQLNQHIQQKPVHAG